METNPTNFSPEAANDDGLDAFVFEGVEAAGDASATAETAATTSPAAMLDEDQFFAMFKGLIGAPNIILQLRGVEPLATLSISDQDGHARAASAALYATCQDVPWLRFLIQPESVWAQRALVIGSFGFGLAAGVRAEIAARRVAAAAARAANDNDMAMNAEARA